jgi:hypothetical protein
MKNLNNHLIDEICLIVDPETKVEDKFFKHNKVTIAILKERPRYNDFFLIVNTHSKPEDINIISNSDIFFNDSLKLIYGIQKNQCYALCRWNIDLDNNIAFFDRRDSQDAWIFKGHISPTIDAGFTLGKPGCDNRIAHEIQKAGYLVSNPSLSIQAIHMHNSNVRHFDWDNLDDRIHPPYLLIEPHIL